MCQGSEVPLSSPCDGLPGQGPPHNDRDTRNPRAGVRGRVGPAEGGARSTQKQVLLEEKAGCPLGGIFLSASVLARAAPAERGVLT